MPPDNSTFSFLPVVMTNLTIIIPIFTAILGGFVGYCVNKYIQKSNNKREKAKEIIREFRTNFLEIINKQITMIEGFQYLDIQENPFTVKLKLDEDILKNYLVNTGLFRIDNGNLIVVYTKDRVFNSYAKKIIENVTVYQLNVNQYSNCLNILNPPFLYPDFEKEVGKLHKLKYGTYPDKDERSPFFLRVLYVVGLTGCKKAITSGRTWAVNLVGQNSLELQNIIRSDIDSKKKADEILTITENIKMSLNNLKEIITDLHDKWQNSQYI
jgi:hypothetical protein